MIAVETREIYPWFSPTVVGGAITINATQPYYGVWQSSNRFDYFEDNCQIRSGTYTHRRLTLTSTSRGIVTFSNRALNFGTNDDYSGGTNFGVIKLITGALLRPGLFRAAVDTKNPLSGLYIAQTTMIRLTRTGA